MATHVAVLKGGWSAAREVSLLSGKACADALRNAGYEVTEIDVGRDLAARLGAVKPDVVFNALQGRGGEDGQVQGMLEVMQLPYTHSGVLASALAMDKHAAKTVFKTAGIAVTDHVIAHRQDIAAKHLMTPPYVVKPIAEDSSVGIFLVREGQEHPPQEILAHDWKGGDQLMVERFILGRDLSCAVMGDVALSVTEIVSDPVFHNYDANNQKDGPQNVIPAPVSPKIYEKVQKMSLKAHEALGCRGVTRSDFRYDERAGDDGGLVCLEINTQPSMIPTSLVPEMAVHAGHTFVELVSWMVEDASCNR